MKIKAGNIQRRCPDGELYKFKNGIAEVPGIRFRRKPMYITLSEFNELCANTTNEE